jgi:outer membrane protein assembly factor BamB
MYVYCASGGVAGVSAADGSPLWDTDAWKINIATVPSPVDLGGGSLFLSGGYNAGALFMRIRKAGGAFAVELGKRLDPETFGSTQQTPIFFGGHIYGVRPDGQLACLDPEGNVVWTSGGGARFGLGPYLIAEGFLYVMDDSGLLTMAEATADGFKPLAQAQVLNGHESWGPLALAGVRLIARDFTRMVCLDIGGSS